MSNATLIKSSKTLILNPHSIHFYNPKAFFSLHYHKDSTDDTQFFFLIYGALCVANSFFTLFRAFFFAYSGILAGKYIHKRLVDNLSKVIECFYYKLISTTKISSETFRET